MIEGIIEEPVVGRIYEGPVKRIMDFGAFVEILPGKEGLVHISKLVGRARRVALGRGPRRAGARRQADRDRPDGPDQPRHPGGPRRRSPRAAPRARRAAARHGATATRRPEVRPRRAPASRPRPRGGDRRPPRGEMGDPHGKTGERGAPAPRAGRPHRHPLHRVLVPPRLPRRGARRAGLLALPRAHAVQGHRAHGRPSRSPRRSTGSAGSSTPSPRRKPPASTSSCRRSTCASPSTSCPT